MKSFTELAANVGGFAMFRNPDDRGAGYLLYVDENLELQHTPWQTVPSEAEVCKFLGILPWEDMPLPILSYLKETS